MTNPVRIRRSAVPGATPTTAQLNLGELGLNTWDGKLFTKRDQSGVESIVELSGGSATIDTTAADVFSATSGVISADDAGADKIVFWDDSAGKLTYLDIGSNLSVTGTTLSGTGGGVSDGDKGDITISSSGTVYTIDNQAVTYAKVQNVSATDKILGRSTAGAGTIEEITCTAAGRALIDDADTTAQRTTLGLGTAATKNITTSTSGPTGGVDGDIWIQYTA